MCDLEKLWAKMLGPKLRGMRTVVRKPVLCLKGFSLRRETPQKCVEKTYLSLIWSGACRREMWWSWERSWTHWWREVTKQLIMAGEVSASWSQFQKESTNVCYLVVHVGCGHWRTWRVDSCESLQKGQSRESHFFHLAIVIPTTEWPNANLDTHMQ